ATGGLLAFGPLQTLVTHEAQERRTATWSPVLHRHRLPGMTTARTTAPLALCARSGGAPNVAPLSNPPRRRSARQRRDRRACCCDSCSVRPAGRLISMRTAPTLLGAGGGRPA